MAASWVKITFSGLHTAVEDSMVKVLAVKHLCKCLPVYEHNDEHNQSHDGGPDPDSHPGFQRKRGLGLAVVLHSAQWEVQVPHSHLEITERVWTQCWQALVWASKDKNKNSFYKNVNFIIILHFPYYILFLELSPCYFYYHYLQCVSFII